MMLSTTPTQSQSTFLTKLYALLERTENHHMIRWDPQGEHIIIERPEQLALHVLPSIYRQSRFSSFSRQLNMYGFMRKVNLRNVDPAVDDPDASTWSHPTLNRHSPPEIVANFKRRVPPRLPKPRRRSLDDQQLNPPARSAIPSGGPSHSIQWPPPLSNIPISYDGMGSHGQSPSNDKGQASSSSFYDTQNRGNSNQIYNGSHVYNNRRTDKGSHSHAVVNVHVHGNRSSSSSISAKSSSAPIASSILASQEITPPATPSPSSSANEEATRGRTRERTRSQRYESLLFECGLGYPLWKPTPRRTRVEEYVVNIGDVGVISDGLPFNTLFNITQPSDSLANKDGVPEGFDPPCVIPARSLTVVDKYHQDGATFVRPSDSISSQDAQNATFSGSRVFNFSLTSSHGALLLLPQGGVLENLQGKTEFTSRIQLHWRQWYGFAEEQGDLGDYHALYLVTGVEKCSTWVIAAWDSTVHVAESGNPQQLSIEIMHDGTCVWRSLPPARCEARSLAPGANNTAKESVFVRGFWINRSNGTSSSSGPPPPPSPFGADSGNDDDDTWGGGDSRNPYLSRRSSEASSQLSDSLSFSGSDHFGVSWSSYSADSPQDETQVTNIALNLLVNGSDVVTHPCEIINKFALKLISNLSGGGRGSSNAGWVAFSHDDDLITIMQDSEEGLPAETGIIKQVCSKFKFVVEEDTIHIATMSIADKVLLQQTSSPDYVDALIIPVLVEFRQRESGHKPRITPRRRAIHARYYPSSSPSPPSSPLYKPYDDGQVPTYGYRHPSRSPSPSTSSY
ncbi:hypothetical protein V5O48_017906 [Marasmius crinis-equi]|uniref:HSF-type DNA-binding domain-containing protein n=1 Tax=Marasmius crinis-equi TaxID=585013 RepID=A0ABR3EMN7_9AGAR